MTQFGQDSKPANGKRLQGLEAIEQKGMSGAIRALIG